MPDRERASLSARPLVSVILPFFATPGAFFRAAVDSVLAQAYDNWELLLVDDGSAEASSSLARGYEREQPRRVRYLEHDGHVNLGHSASRNLGLQRARGELIALLDADDVWLPDKLEDQVSLMEANPDAAMLYANTVYWYSWTGDDSAGQRDFTPELGVEADRMVDPPRLVPLFLNGRAAVPCTCSVLVRRAVADRLGGFEDFFSSRYGDQAFYVKVCLEEPVYVAAGCWDMYRQHPESVTTAMSRDEARRWRTLFLEWVDSYVRSRGASNSEIDAAVRRELWNLRHPAAARVLRLGRKLTRRAYGNRSLFFPRSDSGILAPESSKYARHEPP